MTHITAAASVLAGEVIRVNRKAPKALSIRVVAQLCQGIASLKRNPRIETAVKAHLQSRHPKLTAGLKFINISRCRNWPDAVWRCCGNSSRQWRVNVPRANDM